MVERRIRRRDVGRDYHGIERPMPDSQGVDADVSGVPDYGCNPVAGSVEVNEVRRTVRRRGADRDSGYALAVGVHHSHLDLLSYPQVEGHIGGRHWFDGGRNRRRLRRTSAPRQHQNGNQISHAPNIPNEPVSAT